MNIKASLGAAITYTEVATTLLCSWPPSCSATTIQKIVHKIKWWFLLSMISITLILNVYTMYLGRENLMEVTKFICYTASDAQTFIKMIICKRYYHVFQRLIEEMENFAEKSKLEDRDVLMSCIEQAAPIHLYINLSGIFAGVFMVIGPLMMEDSPQADVKFPFPVDDFYLRGVFYIQQSIVILQCASVSLVDGQVCLFIWFTTARFKMLEKNVININCTNKFNSCIQVHQYLLRYLDEVCKIARPITVTTVIVATVAIVFGAIHIVGDEPFNLRVQFVAIIIAFALQLFISAYAAENLIQASNNLKWSFYKSNWIENPNKLTKTAVIFVQRLNKAPEISVTGIMPQLSLNYYAVYLSKTFSFITTLRVIVNQMLENSEVK